MLIESEIKAVMSFTCWMYRKLRLCSKIIPLEDATSLAFFIAFRACNSYNPEKSNFSRQKYICVAIKRALLRDILRYGPFFPITVRTTVNFWNEPSLKQQKFREPDFHPLYEDDSDSYRDLVTTCLNALRYNERRWMIFYLRVVQNWKFHRIAEKFKVSKQAISQMWCESIVPELKQHLSEHWF